ncbi:MAG: HDIG domain-containing protein [Kiritimatiellae bacterium]|nr:HDIG domain-containing protein [Kiritimatiellia bacterium]
MSRLRIRRARSREQLAVRQKRARRFLDSEGLRNCAGAVALALGLWLMLPSGGLFAWDALLAKATVLVVIGFGGQLLIRVAAAEREAGSVVWLLMLCMALLSLLTVRAVAWLPGTYPQDWLGPHAMLFYAPHAFAPLLVAMLYGGQLAMVIGLIAGVALAMSAEGSLGVLLLSLCASAVAAREAPRLRHRMQILRALARIALWQTPIVLVIAVLSAHRESLLTVALQLAALYLMLLLSGMAVIWVLPLAERATGRTSQITLNYFADLGHPLLHRMALEAPGTYHHSMVVADLAQTAAEAVGANGLLARVGGYYHDIGKLSRPEFYMENQLCAGSPHDALPPNISRMIIVNHVKEGICLGRLHRLPPPLMHMIARHHGTSVIRWFHHKAMTQAAGQTDERATEAEESHYRYAGPLPESKEATIVALADAIEAASRSLEKVTPARIESLVASVVEAKWLDGQFDRSELSNAELCAVRKSFVFTLTHLLHSRLAYPLDDQNRDTEPATEVPDEPAVPS